MRVGLESIQLYHDLTGTLVLLQPIHSKYYVNEQDLDCLLLQDTVEVGEEIDLEQELSDKETPPLIDPIEAEHEGGQDHEHQAQTLGDMAQSWIKCKEMSMVFHVKSLCSVICWWGNMRKLQKQRSQSDNCILKSIPAR